MRSGPPRVNILGVNISAINMQMALTMIDDWIRRKEPRYVCITTTHGVMECQRDRELRAVLNSSGLTTPDGMPLVWLCKAFGHRHVDRVYGPDLMLALCEHSVEQGYRHFFYGGAEGVPEQLANRLMQRFPDLRVGGTYAPPFRPLTPDEDEEVVRRINATNSDIAWVGLGTPKQDKWMADHVGRIEAPILIGVGAAFDFHSGCKQQAPLWMQRNGLEWLFRLGTEPGRLSKRYLVNNPLFMLHMTCQLLGLRRYGSGSETTTREEASE